MDAHHEYSQFHGVEVTKIRPDLKIISFNAAGNLEFNPETLEALKEFDLMGAGVIFLQETGLQPDPNGGSSTLNKIVTQMGEDWEIKFAGYRSSIVGAKPNRNDAPKDEGGICMLVKKNVDIEVEKIYSFSLARYEQGPNFFERFKSIRGSDDRQAIVCILNINGKRLALANIHMDWQGGSKNRQRQLAGLGNQLASEEIGLDGYVVMGDFNIPTSSEAMQTAAVVSYNAHGRQYDDMRVITPDTSTVKLFGLIKMKPDMAVVSSRLNDCKMEVLPNNFGSDHLPISLDITI